MRISLAEMPPQNTRNVVEKHSEVPEQIRRGRQEWLSERWEQLHTLENEWSERAFKFLMVTNAGGAIAMLSFLGSYDQAMSILAAKIALSLFLSGVVILGFGIAHVYHLMSGSLNRLNEDTKSLYRDEMSYATLIERDDERHKDRIASLALPYLSFFAFIFGCACGAYALFTSLPT